METLVSTYLIINIVIILFPFLFSFEKKLSFYKKYLALLSSLIIVGAFFVAWDIMATIRKDWWFSIEHINGLMFFAIPIEELLFFLTVPYSCLFLWEAINFFFKEKKFNYNKKIGYLIGTILVLSAFLVVDKSYTFTALVVLGIVVFLISKFTSLFSSKKYYIFMVLTLGLFIIFNYILTSIPIVNYSSTAIWGARFFTIPLEDFLFNFSMLTCYLAVYLRAKELLKIK